MNLKKYLNLVICILLAACAPVVETPENASPPGLGDLPDAGKGPGSTAAAADAGGTPQSPPGENTPADGFGQLSGDCGVFTDALLAQSPSAVFRNALDFQNDPYDDEDYEYLTEGGQEILDDGNAGGSSILSEVFAYEVLHRCEHATLLKTETEITYNDPTGKITDLLVDVAGTKLGVSVTRAVGYPRDDPYTEVSAKNILEQKLQGVLDSTANVAAADAWGKQVLHIIAYADQHAESLLAAYEDVAMNLKSNTVVLITVSHGDDEFLY